MKRLVIDAETTGLDPERHDMWELGVIELRPHGERTEHLWLLEPDLAVAEPSAIQVSRFYERTAGVEPPLAGGCPDLADNAAKRRWSDPEALAARLGPMLSGATWIGSNPSFDAGFIAPFLRLHGHAAAWNYRLCDVRAMAYGCVMGLARAGCDIWPPDGKPPAATASLADLAPMLGIDPACYDAHTALGDCSFFADVLAVIEGAA